ncbi:hypothetical protein A9P93_00200 [Klebsiella pneumoniae]|nr:hypothetical protein A9P93_00200 [Klebsiella pneumoniae]GKN58700.1 hypothetical protein NUBL17188_39040 [Klebsiella pneumoniae]
MCGIYHVRTGIFLTVLSIPTVAALPAKQGNGRVEMNGQVLAAACSIHTDDIWQEITFDTHSQRTVLSNGGLLEKPFSLRLVNCRLNNNEGESGAAFTVTFDGKPVPGEPSLFSVTGDGRGVALKVVDIKDRIAVPGVAMNNIALNEGGHQLDYRLQVVPSGEEFEEGTWSGAVRFMVAWQ